MFISLKPKTKSSSRHQVGIKAIRNGILSLPGNQYRLVLKVSSLNFELKSEAEQDAIIETYESFLNSVGTNLQILIRTREIDVDTYLENLTERLGNEAEAIYRQQLKTYEEFIRSLVSNNKILARHFYIVVSYGIPGKMDFELVQQHLNLKADIVTKGLARIGIHSYQLTSLEVLDLFYSFYNPTMAKLQPLTEQALMLIHTALIEKGASDV